MTPIEELERHPWPELKKQFKAHRERLARMNGVAKARNAALKDQQEREEQAVAEAAEFAKWPKTPAGFFEVAWNEIGVDQMGLSQLYTGTIATIQRVVLIEYPGVTYSDLKSTRRTAKIVRARQMAMYVARETTPKSLPEIGRLFGNRDHTTVLHAVNKMARIVESDAAEAARVERIKTMLTYLEDRA